MKRLVGVAAGLLATFIPSVCFASLEYVPITLNSGATIIVVRGAFEQTDDLSQFQQLVISSQSKSVTFDSPGGNVAKALELGRLIRLDGLSTMQLRKMDCASACAFAFLGGVKRFAEPGSIGVHRSSLVDGTNIPSDDAVAVVQSLTAEVMQYMSEMGADPALLQLALRYDSTDIRYLSGGEMQQYRVTTGDEQTADVAAAPSYQAPPRPAPTSPANIDAYARVDTSVPVARSGHVRRPKGAAELKVSPDAHSQAVARLRNGTPVQILDSDNRWFKVQTSSGTGYMHHTWISVDQFDESPGMQRHIQIKSFDNYPEALEFVHTTRVPSAIYLASNGWFAVTLNRTFEKDDALAILKQLKSNGSIPSDSLVTLGNTYARRLCCTAR